LFAMAKAATCGKPKRPLELHHGLSPTNCTHAVVDLSTPTLLRQKILIAALMKTTDPDHFAWGPCPILRLTPLPRTMIPESALKATPSPNRRCSHHCTKHANPRLHPIGPVHLPANTDQSAPTTTATHKATPPATTATCRDGSPDAAPPRRA
jgi:hypothetical protein